MTAGARPHRVSYWLAVISAGVAFACLVLIALYAAATPGQHLRYLGAGVLTGVAAFATGCLFGFLFGIPRLVSSGAWRLRPDAGTPAAETHGAATSVGTGGAVTPAETGAATSEEADLKAAAAPATAGTGVPANAGARATDDLRFAPSTNLAEISDWLTKLLLGAGLVSLTRLGAPLGALIDAVAAGLTDVPAGSSPDGPARLIAAAILVAFSVLGFIDFYVLTTLWYGRRLYAQTRW